VTSLPDTVTEAEAESGTLDELRSWTPAKIKSSIDALGSSNMFHVVKQADENYSGTNVLHDDTELFIDDLEANKSYHGILLSYLYLSNGFKDAFSLPTGATGLRLQNNGSFSSKPSTGATSNMTSGQTYSTSGGSNQSFTTHFKIDMGSVDGSLKYQWVSAYSGSVTIYSGSLLMLWGSPV